MNYSPSNFLADVHAKFGFARPEVLPLGWLSVPPAERPGPRTRVVFGYLGQIISRKGLDLLVSAAQQLRGTNWELRVYGEAYQPDYFAQLKRVMKKHPRIRYCGAFTPDDLGKLHSEIDVAVVPSRRENYPLTVLEALSARVPVIATDVGGVRDIVEDGVDGLVVPPHSDASLAVAMTRFLNDPALVDRLRSTIRPVKTIAANAREYEAVYGAAPAAATRAS